MFNDGVKIDSNGRYIIVCQECGCEYSLNYHTRKAVRICPECKNAEKGKRDFYTAHAKEVKFDEAVYRIKSVVKNWQEYQSAVASVKRVLHRKGWFQSTEEIMAAIELMKNNIRVIPQQKVGKYKVDFCLPDKKVILEIDGAIYHQDKIKEGIRDGNIQLQMGLDWHIVRINTERINSNITKLLEAIDGIVAEQEITRKNIRRP